MKEKIINYIETLEAKSLQADDYFIQRNELYISNQEKDKEIERLNNIINEFDNWLDLALEVFNNVDVKTLELVKRKLQELKGSDSNE